ncbi:MAG: hypothetical protein WC654_05090, partial [Patescibacteria group bacterium]
QLEEKLAGQVTVPKATSGARGQEVSRVSALAKRDDPRMIASLLMSGEIEVSQVPAPLYEAVLLHVCALHRAVVARTQETVRCLKLALTQTNQTVRDRDGSHGETLSEIERHRRTAQSLGSQSLKLREELDRQIAKVRKLGEELRIERNETDEMRIQMETLRASQLGTSEGALMRVFLDLVNVQLSEWLGARDTLLGRARFLVKELDAKVREADELLSETKAAIEDAEGTRLDRNFSRDEHAWSTFLDRFNQMRVHRVALDNVHGEISRLTDKRRACATAYDAHKQVGDELSFKVRALVQAFSLVAIDAWERAGLNPKVLDRLEPPIEVVLLMIQAVPVPRLDGEWRTRADALQAHILSPRTTRSSKQTPCVDPQTEAIHFFPGSIFMVEPEREVERLVCLVLEEAQLCGIKTPLLYDEIASFIQRAGLSSKPHRELMQDVGTACSVLLKRGVVSQREREIEGVTRHARAFLACEPQCSKEANNQLAQVEGGRGALLKARIARMLQNTTEG